MARPQRASRVVRVCPRTTAQVDLADPVDPVALVAPVRAGPPGAAVAAMARADPEDPPGITAREDPMGQADLVGLVATARADPADLVDPGTTALVGLVGPATTVRADPVDPATTARADPVDPADGMEILSVATSTGNRGETEPHRGDMVRRPGQDGADRSRRPVGAG